MTKVMTINSGSSSLKFKLYEMPEEIVLCSGIAERIGLPDGIFTIKYGGNKDVTTPSIPNHAVAVKLLMDNLIEKGIISSYDEIAVTGHRVVQGGKYYSSSTLFTPESVERIESLSPLAPLHNPAHLVCYRAFQEVLPNVPAVAVFDTAYHATMEPQDYLFPIPYELTEKYDIRRYGAHGTSHHYLALESAKYVEGIENPKIISCHIGSGASITAIKNGKCVATSMGLTPLGGIMMGTRTGDMDPSVFHYLCTVTGKSADEVYNLLNKKSGFLGVSQVSNDSRDVLAGVDRGDKNCILANDLFNRRIADYIGQYYVRLGGADLIIFSAGMGENEPRLRRDVCNLIKDALGIEIDPEANASRGKEVVISTPNSKVKVVVIPTDEEVMIARDAYKVGLGK